MTSHREWQLDEIREECAEHTESGAAGLPADRARLIVELIDDHKALLAALERLVEVTMTPSRAHDGPEALRDARSVIAMARGA